MNTNIKIFLLCPVPEDQKPINEYIGLKENPLTNWTTLSKKNYLKKIMNLFLINLSLICLLNLNTVLVDFNHFFNWLITNTFISFNLISLFFIVILFRWKQTQNRFEQTRLVYEEGSWYDTQIWEKPFLIIKNDKLISTQKIEPVIQRLLSTLFICIYFDIILLILMQI
jgi:hypothetical protein